MMKYFLTGILALACGFMLTACSGNAHHDAAYYEHHPNEAQQKVNACRDAVMSAKTGKAKQAAFENPDCQAARNGLGSYQRQQK